MKNRRIRGWLSRFGFALAAMGLTFVLVLFLLQRGSSSAITAEGLEDADQLRQYSNELLDLTSEYLDRVPESDAPIDRDTRDWIDWRLRPQLNDLQQRMLRSEVRHPALPDLIAASDRAASMASQPEDRALRIRGIDLILDATESVETALREDGLATRLETPGRTPGFGRPASR